MVNPDLSPDELEHARRNAAQAAHGRLFSATLKASEGCSPQDLISAWSDALDIKALTASSPADEQKWLVIRDALSRAEQRIAANF